MIQFLGLSTSLNHSTLLKTSDAGVAPNLQEFLDRNLTIQMNHDKKYRVDTYFEETMGGFTVNTLDPGKTWSVYLRT